MYIYRICVIFIFRHQNDLADDYDDDAKNKDDDNDDDYIEAGCLENRISICQRRRQKRKSERIDAIDKGSRNLFEAYRKS